MLTRSFVTKLNFTLKLHCVFYKNALREKSLMLIYSHFAFCEMRNKYYLCPMRKHNGMRPQDIAVLMKIIAIGNSDWRLTDLSNSMFISLSEISESLNRSRVAGLIDYNKDNVNRNNLLEFLEHGVKYVFPVEPGASVKGIPTAHSHPFMKKHLKSEINYVWRDPAGDVMGSVIDALYPKQIDAVKSDPVFYKLLALIDVIRVGRVREINIASQELAKMIRNEAK